MQAEYFDFIKAAREAGVTADQLERIVREHQREYGSDRMMMELRLLRLFHSISDGFITVEKALAPPTDPAKRAG